MFHRARLRLTLWYVTILGAIIAVLSVLIYHLLMQVQGLEVQAVTPRVRHGIVVVFAHDQRALAAQIAAVDLGMLALAVLGAYMLSGRTLAPIQQTVERQQRFAAAASHELRTPLTVLRGTMEVALLSRRTPDEYEDVLREAAQEVHRMSSLVNDLLLLARAQSDRDALNLEDLDLRTLAAEAVAGVVPLANSSEQRLQTSLTDPLPVYGDAVKLRQVLQNLLENAVAFTGAGGSITVVGRRTFASVALEIRDTGPGICPEDLGRIFEPFYRVPGTHSGYDHAGLGLAISDWIVRAHDGTISVSSRVDHGSVFTLTLPLGRMQGG